MKRLVSYFYEYSNGKKGPNVGFGKIDTSTNQMKINITLRYNSKKECLKVYFFVKKSLEKDLGEENTNTKLIYIGEMKKRGQEYEIKQTINLLEVLEDRYTFNELHGMIIEPENHKAAVSFWKEEYVIKCGTEYKVEAKEINNEASNEDYVEEKSHEVIEEDTIYMVDDNCIPVEKSER